MKAVVKHKKGKGKDTIKLMEVDEPKPKNDELKIRVIAAGICGTDIHIMQDEYDNNPPVILGHEFVGIIEECGQDVKGFQKGEYVISLTAVETCGKCKYCRQDLRMLCNKRKSLGSGVNGAMAEYVVVPADLAFKVPEEVTDIESLAISEPYACVVRAVIEMSTVNAGDIVLVSGPGTIGLITVQIAKAQGAYVIVSGLPNDIQRLELAMELGADKIVTNKEELFQVLNKVAPYGADVVFECAGVGPSADICIEAVKKGGIFSQVGLYGKKIPLDMDKLLFKEVKVTNSYATERTSWEIYLRLLRQNKICLTPLITKKLPLDKWEEGFNYFLNKEGFKVVLKP